MRITHVNLLYNYQITPFSLPCQATEIYLQGNLQVLSVRYYCSEMCGVPTSTHRVTSVSGGQSSLKDENPHGKNSKSVSETSGGASNCDSSLCCCTPPSPLPTIVACRAKSADSTLVYAPCWLIPPSPSCTKHGNTKNQNCARRSYLGNIQLFCNVVMIVCFVVALSGTNAEAFGLSVFFLVWMLRIAIAVGMRWLEADPDTVIYFAPWVREGNHSRRRREIVPYSVSKYSVSKRRTAPRVSPFFLI